LHRLNCKGYKVTCNIVLLNTLEWFAFMFMLMA